MNSATLSNPYRYPLHRESMHALRENLGNPMVIVGPSGFSSSRIKKELSQKKARSPKGGRAFI